MTIDINCDMGESFGNFHIGSDAAIMPFITSANIACGFHGGDAYHIEKTIESALKHGVQIGAHPSYPDLQGFGRRKMNLQKEELKSIIKYQIGALKSLAESQGGSLKYVKPHGALYNSIANDSEEGKTVLEAIKSIDPSLKFMGLAGSGLEAICLDFDIEFIAEAFADRRYEKNGQLRSRYASEAVIHHPETAAEQVRSIIQNKQTITLSGEPVSISAQSFCIHGDNPAAVKILEAIDHILNSNKIQKRAF